MGVGHSPRDKSFDHAHGAKTAIHVIAQENRHDMVERLTFHIGLDALGHLTEQIVTTMNIAHAVHPRPIWDTTRGRNRGRRFPTRLDKRIYPPHEFRGPQLLGQAVSLNRVVSYAHHKQRIRISWAGAFARPDFERPVMRPDKWRLIPQGPNTPRAQYQLCGLGPRTLRERRKRNMEKARYNT